MKAEAKFMAIVGIFILFVIVAVVYAVETPDRNKNNQNRIGAVFNGAVSDRGWNGKNYEGLLNACNEVGTILITEERVAVGREEETAAVHRLIENDCTIIFLTDFDYTDKIPDIIKANPNINFYAVAGSDFKSKNLTYYAARSYEARYISGILAGYSSNSGKAGYISEYDNNASKTEINAFVTGFRKVNHSAELHVIYKKDESDENRKLVDKLAAKGCDCISSDGECSEIMDEAEKLNLYTIGCYEDRTSIYDKNLVNICCDLTELYRCILSDCIIESDYENHLLFDNCIYVGMKDGIFLMTSYGKAVSKEAVMVAEREIAGLENSYTVFSGNIRDTNGLYRCLKGENIPDNLLLKGIDWYARGVLVDE